MKIKIVKLSYLVLLMGFSSWAQHSKQKISFERLKSLKINFIIEHVDLNIEEETFVWNTYDRYATDTHKKYHKKMRSLRRNLLGNNEAIDEPTATQMIDSIHYFRSQKEVLEKKLFATLKTKLTSKQILQIYIAEEQFHKRMINRLKHKKKN